MEIMLSDFGYRNVVEFIRYELQEKKVGFNRTS